MSRMRPRQLFAGIVLVAAALAITLATSAALGNASSSGSSDLTLSFDSNPYLSEFDAVQTGYRCLPDGRVNFTIAGQSRPADQAFVRDGTIKRDGESSAHVFLQPGDFSSYSCQKEAVQLLKGLGDSEGTDAWYGWSWRLPTNWSGTNSWGTLLEFTTNASLWPSYGQLTFDAAIRDRLIMQIKTGRIPSPGASDFNPIAPNGYKSSVTLLGPAAAAPRPLTLGVWHDFYMHILWRSRSNGVLTIWHREEGGSWGKLYDNTGAPDALVKAPAHPTLMYNDRNGAPGENGQPGLALEAGFYRANQSIVNDYWFDGFRRRQSEAAILSGFPGTSTTPVVTQPAPVSQPSPVNQPGQVTEPVTTQPATVTQPTPVPPVTTNATTTTNVTTTTNITTSAPARPDTAAPSAPTRVTAKPMSKPVRVQLSWKASADNVAVLGYRIYRNGSLVGTTPGHSYVDSTAAARATYSYRLTAFDAAGNASPPSITVKVRSAKR
jgi:hypothetical protein